MKTVFVDTSGFYALLDAADSAHKKIAAAFLQAEKENWQLITTNYVVHETWAIIQHRLGWKALEAFLDVVLPSCEIQYVTESLFALGAVRCRQARQRKLSLADCISLEFIRQKRIGFVIAEDRHFWKEGLKLPLEEIDG
ncbi:MAG: type II toxin-antitoxin system VapC family toxin [Thermoguttaceae bacterium]